MNYKNLLKSLKGDRMLTDRGKIAKIKNELKWNDYKIALESYPLLYGVLKRNAFFSDVDKIVVKTPYYFTNSIKKELHWALVQILPNLKKINSFISKKNEFENQFLLEKYDYCETLLDEIKGDFGVSLWYFESKLLLSTYVGGNEANWTLLSDLLKGIKNPFYEFNINSSGKRFEKNFSFESYFNQFQNDITSINADSVVKDYFVFKNFSVAKYDYKYKSLESVLFLSNIFSLIDLYLIFIDIIIYNFCSESEINFSEILEIISDLKIEITNDNRLNNIYNLLSNNTKIDNYSDLLIDCLDSYYAGEYEKSQSLCSEGIQAYPCEFEFYVIYAKTLIELNSEFKPTKISNIIDELIEALYRLFLFDENSEQYSNSLLKLTIVLHNFPISKQLCSLMVEIDGDKNRFYYSGILYGQFTTPKFLSLVQQYNLDNNFDFLSDTHSYKVASMKLGLLDYSSYLKGNNRILMKAEYSYCKSCFQDVVDLEEQTTDFLNFHKEKYIGFLYDSYINLKQYKNAVELYIKYYFDKHLYFKKLKYHNLLNELKDEDLIDYSDTLDFVIFASLDMKEYDLYEILDEFLASIDVYKIKEIDFNFLINTYTLEKVIFLLKNVLVIDVIKYFDYSSISNVEEDRVGLLNKLIEIDSENKEDYELQINKIYRTNSVRKVLKDVDEGRLYIDVENLEKYQVKRLNDDFRRFKDIETYSQSVDLIGFNSSNKRDWETAIKERIDFNAQYNSADYLAFKNIYIESRENFLYSKEYGLESCLSTRIRHGALKNHIRSVFEKLDLITVKSNEEYQDNVNISNQLHQNVLLNESIQLLLKEFSKNVDDLNTSIINNYMQIRTERSKDNTYGLFSYLTNDEILFDFYTRHKSLFDSAESIVSLILESLVHHTLLEVARVLIDFFTDFILKEFEGLIDILITNLKTLQLPNDFDILMRLNKSKTEIQKELEYISDWFFLSTDSSSTLLDFETILQASIELTNKINPLFVLDPKISIINNVWGYSNFIFIFNILLNNVIEHSKVERDDLKLTVEVLKSADEKYTIVKFTNNLNPNFDYIENVKKLTEVKYNWNDHSRIERSNKEKGSGFDKIKRILIYEARAKTDIFNFEMKNNEMSILLYLPYSERKKDE